MNNQELFSNYCQTVRECKRCEIRAHTPKPAPAYGDITSPLLIVGEGPGEEEASQGIPFVGRTGTFLIDCMDSVGLDRAFVMTSNVIRCRGCWSSNGKLINRSPTEKEIDNCRVYTTQLVELMKPKLILCVGGVAASEILGRPVKITQERGKTYTSRYGIPAYLTIHPSFIVRQQEPELSRWTNILKEDIIESVRLTKELMK